MMLDMQLKVNEANRAKEECHVQLKLLTELLPSARAMVQESLPQLHSNIVIQPISPQKFVQQIGSQKFEVYPQNEKKSEQPESNQVQFDSRNGPPHSSVFTPQRVILQGEAIADKN